MFVYYVCQDVSINDMQEDDTQFDISLQNIARDSTVFVKRTPCLVVDVEENVCKSDVVFDPGLPFLDGNEDSDMSAQEILYVPWNSDIGHIPEYFSYEVEAGVIETSLRYYTYSFRKQNILLIHLWCITFRQLPLKTRQ